MPLSTGEKLGPYEIRALIGKGGMGEVYRAHDDRLRRDVAIKVSKDQFTERFTREARTIASLNHTNICHLYDVGPNYLVMEYVEGADLKGPLDFDDALPIIQQIIDGIEAAHEKNIIHRDLKPANIKITPEGVVKILDFGLAKAMEPPPSHDADPSNSPTLTMGATVAGTILGTAAYMAPEQAKGKAADKRCDIWSFGVVVYEMLTGKRLFQGESVVEILGGVLNKEPDISAAPARVHRLLKWCLEKDRKKRLAAISDARGLLDEVAALAAAPPAPQRMSWLWPAVATVLMLGAGAASWGWWNASRPELRPLLRFDVDMGPLAATSSIASAVLSPDGTQVAYRGRMPDGAAGLYLRRLDQPEGRLVTPFGANAGVITFSPDGQWLLFGSGSTIRKVSPQGGAAVTLGQTAHQGMTWSEDGHVYIGNILGLIRGQESGGLEPVPGARPAVFPHALPGGKALLIAEPPESRDASSDRDVSVLTLATGARKRLVQGAFQPAYIAAPGGDGGYLLYAKQRTLFAVPFDPDTQELRGTALPLLDDLRGGINVGAQYSVSRNGTLAYLRATGLGSTTYPMMQMDSAGITTPVLAKQGVYTSPRYSPDGKRIAYVEGSDVWVYDLERRVPTQLTFTATPKSELAWAADSKHILIGAGNQLFWMRADGGTQPRVLLENPPGVRVYSTAPDGRVAFGENYTGWGLTTVPLDLSDPENPKAGKPELFQDPKAFRVDAAFSPDGKFLALVETDTEELFVTPFPGPGGKWKISGSGGKFPVWSKTGHQLFFLGGDERIMVADYSVNGDSFQASIPRAWSPTPVLRLGVTANFDVYPDGKHVVMFPAAQQGATPGNLHITFLLNLADELQRRFAEAKK
ncbi:MAG: protein kinase [Acidobacteriota bacterium]